MKRIYPRRQSVTTAFQLRTGGEHDIVNFRVPRFHSERSFSSPGLNNKTVGLAYLGQLDAAAELLRQIIIDQAHFIAQPALLATTGLLFFRAGDLEQGRFFYEKAINHRYSRQDRRCHVLALWHLAREEVRLKSTEAAAAVARTERASKDMKMADINTLRDRLAEGVKKMSHSGSAH